MAMPTKKARIQPPKNVLPKVPPVSENLKSDMKMKLFPFVLGGAVFVLGALLFMFKGLFIAAIVNNQPISRIAYTRELEKMDGKKTLNAMITKTLLLQEASKRKIVVTQADIDAEIKKIDASLTAQGQKLDDLLAAQGMTKEDLNEEMKIQKSLEKMFEKELVASESEILAFVETNSASFPKEMTEDQKQATAIQDLKQQKLNAKVQELIAELQKKSNVQTFVK